MSPKIAGVVALALLAGGLALPAAAILSTVAPSYAGVSPAQAAVVQPCGAVDVGSVAGWDEEQTSSATIIVGVGRERGVPERGWLIALMTAAQESGLRNLDYGDRDSLGLFQQRAGWGTVAQRMDPVYASNKFYGSLVQVQGWEAMRLTEAAQAVQRSAFPEAYARWEADARGLLAQLGATVAPSCDTTTQPSAGSWVRPLAHYRISDTYKGGYRSTGGHSGIDLAAPIGTIIVAVGAGRVTTAGWEGAYGNMVCVDHGEAVTCYAHQSALRVRPGQTVTAGQPVGAVGVTGNTTGPHLHFEVRLGGAPVNPGPWMSKRGVPL